MEDAKQVEALQNRIKPFMLHRRKADIGMKLPPKEEILIEVELTTVQKKHYRAVYDRNREMLSKRVKLDNISMQLRKVCCHPYLVPWKDEKQVKMPLACTAYTPQAMDDLIAASGKFVLLDKVCFFVCLLI